MNTNRLTQERLKELLEYNSETGIFAWKRLYGLHKKSDRTAGCIKGNGYVVIRIDDVLYHAHRLAWLWEYGAWPKKNIDHINGIRSDNHIANLRDVSVRENGQNMLKHRLLGMKVLGATLAPNGKWRSRKRIDGKVAYLGTFATMEEAHAAYLAAGEGTVKS
jgi:hypothetical protein